MGPPESETPDLAGTGSSVEEEMAGRAKSGDDDSSDPGRTPASNVVALPVAQHIRSKTKLEVQIELMSISFAPTSPEARLFAAMGALRGQCLSYAEEQVTVDRDALRMVLGHLDWCHAQLGLFTEGGGVA